LSRAQFGFLISNFRGLKFETLGICAE